MNQTLALQRRTGRVMNFCPERKFGFIQPDDGSPAVFVHFRDCGRRDLDPGQRVAFSLGAFRGRPCAVNVAVSR